MIPGEEAPASSWRETPPTSQIPILKYSERLIWVKNKANCWSISTLNFLNLVILLFKSSLHWQSRATLPQTLPTTTWREGSATTGTEFHELYFF